MTTTVPRAPVRAAVFTDNDFVKVNGVTTALSALLRYAPPGVEPRIYTHSDRAVERPGYLALRAPGVGLPFCREMRVYLPRLRRLCARVRADRVQLVHLTTPGPMGLAALHIAAALDLPLIGSFHTDFGRYVRMLGGSARLERWLRLYLRWLYGRCERILVPSAATGAMLVDDGIEPRRIARWTRGVDAEAFSPARRSEALRRAWGVGGDAARAPLALLYAGRVSKEKGLALLPEAAARLRRAGVAHRWIVVGDGAWRPDLARRLPDAVFTGTLDRRGVARAMASADVFVFPSCTDTAGNVVLEAQACGLPVVVTDQGGPQENMLTGVTGRVFRGGDADGLAAAVADLASNRERRRRMSAAARRHAESRRWEDASAPLYDAYRTVAARRGAASRPRVSVADGGRGSGRVVAAVPSASSCFRTPVADGGRRGSGVGPRASRLTGSRAPVPNGRLRPRRPPSHLTGSRAPVTVDGRRRPPGPSAPTVAAVLADVAARPHHYLVARWNWKAALLSGVLRGLVFYAATRGAGPEAARTALAVEFAYRVAATGCFASLAQAFRRATPEWAAAAVVTVAVPAAAHALQFGAHGLAGTVDLDRGMAASVAFSVVSAAFTLYSMRRGVLIVGEADRRPFRRDLAALPGLAAGFAAAVVRRMLRRSARPDGADGDRGAV